jgi:hypothetical protein
MRFFGPGMLLVILLRLAEGNNPYNAEDEDKQPKLQQKMDKLQEMQTAVKALNAEVSKQEQSVTAEEELQQQKQKVTRLIDTPHMCKRTFCVIAEAGAVHIYAKEGRRE